MDYLLPTLQIIAVDILLSGDNALVIALACRGLPPHQRRLGITYGVVGAVALRLALIAFALQLLALPFFKLIGAALLLWIGVKLLRAEEAVEQHAVAGSTSLLRAIGVVMAADAAMSLDNVIAIASAARGNLGLVAAGIVISIPLIVWGSRMVMWLLDRFPVLVMFGAALLGWLAGQMAISDPLVEGLVVGPWEYAFAGGGAALVVALAKLLDWVRPRALA